MILLNMQGLYNYHPLYELGYGDVLIDFRTWLIQYDLVSH